MERNPAKNINSVPQSLTPADEHPTPGMAYQSSAAPATRPVTVVTEGMTLNPRHSFVPIRAGQESPSMPPAATGAAAMPELPAMPPAIRRQTLANESQAVRLQPKFSSSAYAPGGESQALPILEQDGPLAAKRRLSVLKDKGVDGEADAKPGAVANPVAQAPVHRESGRTPQDELVTPPPSVDSSYGPRGLDKRARSDRDNRSTP